MQTIDQILAGHPFFSELKPQYIDLMAGCASNVFFHADEYLFREGKEANSFFLIKTGTVTIQMEAPSRPPLVVETIGEGDIIGWSWLVPPYQWMFDARAREDTRALSLDGKCLRTKCEENHDLGFELLKRVTAIMENRLQSARVQVMDNYGRQA